MFTEVTPSRIGPKDIALFPGLVLQLFDGLWKVVKVTDGLATCYPTAKTQVTIKNPITGEVTRQFQATKSDVTYIATVVPRSLVVNLPGNRA